MHESHTAFVLHCLLLSAVSVLRQAGLSKAEPMDKIKWRMAPLLSGGQLLQTDSKDQLRLHASHSWQAFQRTWLAQTSGGSTT